jgi:hypothetical protein
VIRLVLGAASFYQEISLHAESGEQIWMIRAASGRKKDIYEVTWPVDMGRQAVPGGVGPDRAEIAVPWLKTNFSGHRLPWVLLARFKEESWIHCLASSPPPVPAERLASSAHLQVLVVSFDPSANQTAARLYKKGSLVAELVAAGRGEAPLEVISFKSVHPKSFLKKCKTVRQAVESFCAAVDARLRDLTAFTTHCGLEFQDSQGRAIGVDKLEELAVTCYAPVTSAENPASVRLKAAIDIGDVAAARQAIADGASLEFLPDVTVSPLSIALNYRCPGDWVGVARALVEAGAPIDGYDWEDPPIFFWIGALARLSNNTGVIKGLEATLALGGDINCPARIWEKGSTPLHYAVNRSLPAIAEFLVGQGASLKVRDAQGLTPLELARLLAKEDPPVDLRSGANSDDPGDDQPDRKLSLLEFIIAQHSGNPDDEVRRRARIVQLLRRAKRAAPGKKRLARQEKKRAARKKKRSRSPDR